MSTIKYFSGAVELVYIRSLENKKFADKFPGIIGRRFDGYAKLVGYAAGATKDGQELPVDRIVEFKSNARFHECDARCLNASGKIMRCECSCGGKNHGRGASISKPGPFAQ